MLFSSHTFIFLFLPICIIGFTWISKALGPSAGKLWLTVLSLVFYGWWHPGHLLVIVPSILFNFSLGSIICSRVQAVRNPSVFVVLAVSANLFLLGYFKYFPFILTTANQLLGFSCEIPALTLPLGISFFTFTQISFILDASRRKAQPVSLKDFFLFVTFFPHLIAGPVIHHSEMMPQFDNPKNYRFNWQNFSIGFWLFAVGLGKKVMIADGLSTTAGKVFGAALEGKPMYALDAWAGVLAYTFQIYFDFSGYSDMAIGLAKMFGIVLPLNFNSPYKATSMIDFWRSWHMTLSRFLKDYVYVPLGGSRGGATLKYANLVITMLVGGIWHGAGWTFIFWGAFHGILLMANHWWRAVYHQGISRVSALSPWRTWMSRVGTFALVTLGWVLFRSENLSAASHLFGSMFRISEIPQEGTATLLKAKMWIWISLLLFWVWFLPNVAQITSAFMPYEEVTSTNVTHGLFNFKLHLTKGWAVFAGLIIALSLISMSRVSEFLYYNF